MKKRFRNQTKRCKLMLIRTVDRLKAVRKKVAPATKAFKNRKKEASKKACRGFRPEE